MKPPAPVLVRPWITPMARPRVVAAVAPTMITTSPLRMPRFQPSAKKAPLLVPLEASVALLVEV
jgi:hypothetical protein